VHIHRKATEAANQALHWLVIDTTRHKTIRATATHALRQESTGRKTHRFRGIVFNHKESGPDERTCT
jgi:hypothetical protein